MKRIFSMALVFGLVPLAVLAAPGETAYDYLRQNRGRPLVPKQVNPKWLNDCGSCHIAFPPGTLPAESWRKIMSGLDKHFGADASLPADEKSEIEAFLIANPSNRWNTGTSPLRITEAQWFKVKHQTKGGIQSEMWGRSAIKSPANCEACHLDANEGDFDKNRVRIPPG